MRTYIPQLWSEGITLTEVNLDENNFIYIVKLDDAAFDSYTKAKLYFERRTLDSMLEGIVSSDNADQKLFVECIIAAQVGIQYRMWNENSSEFVTFTLPNRMIKSAYEAYNVEDFADLINIEDGEEEDLADIIFIEDGNAADVEEFKEAAVPFQLIEVKPLFQGGDANQFAAWVNSQLVYPELAKENGIQGRVTLQFVIENDGTLTELEVLRGVHPTLDQEAVRVVSMSPKWTPGKFYNGRAARVSYIFPIVFKFTNNSTSK